MPDAKRWYALAGLVVVLDQLSKWVVLDQIRLGDVIYVAPFWNWVLTYNPGRLSAFSPISPVGSVGSLRSWHWLFPAGLP